MKKHKKRPKSLSKLRSRLKDQWLGCLFSILKYKQKHEKKGQDTILFERGSEKEGDVIRQAIENEMINIFKHF